MATELHISSDLVETDVEPQRRQAPAARPSLRTRLQSGFFGRALLGCMEWAVVIGLVVSGYFGAEAVSAGIALVQSSDTPTHTHQILAASAPGN